MPQAQFSQVLPANWDGRFPFTNPSDEDFVFVWSKKAYLFPAHHTVDMMRMNFNATPLEVQQIRKKAAKKLAEREFFKSPKYESLRALEGVKDENGVIQPRLGSFNSAASYSDAELNEIAQQYLVAAPEAAARVADAPVRDISKELHRDDETGELVSKVVKKDTGSLGDTKTFADSEVLVN
ncbi:MAG: hypothetical protein KGJ90_02130 [Patescibacteria group bacterium]|nr:hypothetical protein [Patescibacteria group bacterium]